MSHLQVYRQSLSLLTDLYQLTMAYGYWRSGIDQSEAVFHLFFRNHPFGSGFTVSCGLHTAIEFLERFRYRADDLAYLQELRGNDKQPLFEDAFLDHLGQLVLDCDIDAIPEGTVVFPQEPLIRVRGSLLQAQLIETALLNCINFETLVATKAARVCLAAGGDPVLEFGLRRAQGPDGGISASRAAYVGGCAGTSNVLAGKLFGIPVRGTHAHSWVMAFETEMEAFEEYSRAMPNNCLLLVDTYDTLEGVRKAAEIGRRLREQGHEMVGVRLDSGDLAGLSKEARRILNDAGLENAVIVASNDLDEHLIAELKRQGARINVWGVGTKLATAFDQPALGGVYKLSAIRRPGEQWRYTLKLSEQPVKVSTPGILQVRRFHASDGSPLADAVFDINHDTSGPFTLIDPLDPDNQTDFPGDAAAEDLLVPIFRSGRLVYRMPETAAARTRTIAQLASLDESVKRLAHPARYLVGLERQLHDVKSRMISGAED
jgi:nicotinate phosphoribosyltransferase